MLRRGKEYRCHLLTWRQRGCAVTGAVNIGVLCHLRSESVAVEAERDGGECGDCADVPAVSQVLGIGVALGLALPLHRGGRPCAALCVDITREWRNGCALGIRDTLRRVRSARPAETSPVLKLGSTVRAVLHGRFSSTFGIVVYKQL